jgi:alpha-amylase
MPDLRRRGDVFCRAALLAASGLLACSRSPDVRPQATEPENQPEPVSELAFVHLFEWPWADVARECESYLGPAGFTGVQVSPPSEHAVLPGFPWWQRYQLVSYALDESRSGTLGDFRDMVSRCAAAGVGVYVDAVINHTTAQASGTGSHGTRYTKYEYPGLFAEDDFHAPHCVIAGSDYADAPERVRSCELLGLADLDTSKAHVQDALTGYLAGLVELGVRGFRIDAAKHIAPEDLGALLRRVDERTGEHSPYYFLEVIDHGTEAIRAADYLAVGAAERTDVTEFKYTAIGDKFLKKDGAKLADLRELLEPTSDLLPADRAVVFTTNHDTERASAVYYADGARLDLATVFLLAWPYGHPSILSSYAFDRATQAGRDAGPLSDAAGKTLPVYPAGADLPACSSEPAPAAGSWLCQHRRAPLAKMLAFRRATAREPAVTHFWDDGGDQIAFGRGARGFVVINGGDVALDRTFETGLPRGRYCNVLASSTADGACSAGAAVDVDDGGLARIAASPMTAAAIHVGAPAD